MARGYPGAFGRKLNAPYVWMPLCLLFLAPFVDSGGRSGCSTSTCSCCSAFGVSHCFFNRGEIGVSVAARLSGARVPARAHADAASGRAGAAGRWCRTRRSTLLTVGLVFLAAFRIGLNMADSNVIDVGYAGVIGADRIADGERSTATASRATSSAATPTAR